MTRSVGLAALSGGTRGSDWTPDALTATLVALLVRVGLIAIATADAVVEELDRLSELAWGAAERYVETSDDATAQAVRFFGPEQRMIGVLIVAVVLFLMPTILGRVSEAQPANISGPLGNINSSEQAASIIEFGWLVPLLMIVFLVFVYLRQAR
jgi:hypothetical protein